MPFPLVAASFASVSSIDALSCNARTALHSADSTPRCFRREAGGRSKRGPDSSDTAGSSHRRAATSARRNRDTERWSERQAPRGGLAHPHPGDRVELRAGASGSSGASGPRSRIGPRDSPARVESRRVRASDPAVVPASRSPAAPGTPHLGGLARSRRRPTAGWRASRPPHPRASPSTTHRSPGCRTVPRRREHLVDRGSCMIFARALREADVRVSEHDVDIRWRDVDMPRFDARPAPPTAPGAVMHGSRSRRDTDSATPPCAGRCRSHPAKTSALDGANAAVCRHLQRNIR